MVWEILIEEGISQTLIYVFQSMYKNTRIKIKINTKLVVHNQGVKQSSPLSSWLFKIHIYIYIYQCSHQRFTT